VRVRLIRLRPHVANSKPRGDPSSPARIGPGLSRVFSSLRRLATQQRPTRVVRPAGFPGSTDSPFVQPRALTPLASAAQRRENARISLASATDRSRRRRLHRAKPAFHLTDVRRTICDRGAMHSRPSRQLAAAVASLLAVTTGCVGRVHLQRPAEPRIGTRMVCALSRRSLRRSRPPSSLRDAPRASWEFSTSSQPWTAGPSRSCLRRTPCSEHLRASPSAVASLTCKPPEARPSSRSWAGHTWHTSRPVGPSTSPAFPASRASLQPRTNWYGSCLVQPDDPANK
jgi:hypothetical protein